MVCQWRGFSVQSDLSLGVLASLSQAGSERRASLDASVNVSYSTSEVGHLLNLKAFPLKRTKKSIAMRSSTLLYGVLSLARETA